MGLFLAGYIIIGIALVTLYWNFLRVYQATHDVWRPRNIPWRLNYSPRESLEQLSATFRRDANPKVENARRLVLAVLALIPVWLIGVPVAAWLFRPN